jgi:transcription initiation factor TFIID subunit TAF12
VSSLEAGLLLNLRQQRQQQQQQQQQHQEKQQSCNNNNNNSDPGSRGKLPLAASPLSITASVPVVVVVVHYSEK